MRPAPVALLEPDECAVRLAERDVRAPNIERFEGMQLRTTEHGARAVGLSGAREHEGEVGEEIGPLGCARNGLTCGRDSVRPATVLNVHEGETAERSGIWQDLERAVELFERAVVVA